MVGEDRQTAWRKRPLGSIGLMVDPLCFGTAELGELKNFPYAVGEERAVATARAILAGPTNFVDTASGYGESERRLGIALRERGGLPDGFVLATKVGCQPPDSSSGGDQTRRSVERSLHLLGLEHLQLVYIHNPEFSTFERVMAPDGPVEALRRYKDQGVVGHIGVAGGEIGVMTRFMQTGAFEVVLCHNRYTLLNMAADPLWDYARRLGLGTVNGAVYGGGILSKGPDTDARYAYTAAAPGILENAFQLQALCSRHHVPLAAATLQISLREPRIDTTAVGISRPERVTETLTLARYSIPDELWAELRTVEPSREDFPS
jgi:D-threo-aldose 1-dehydrogenase